MKWLKNYLGLYMICEEGFIISYKKYPPKVLKTNDRPDKYQTVKLLDKYSNRHDYYIHRLVAETFLDWDPTLEVNHKNGKKNDNRVENLELVTRQENMKHAYDNKLIDNRGDKHWRRVDDK